MGIFLSQIIQKYLSSTEVYFSLICNSKIIQSTFNTFSKFFFCHHIFGRLISIPFLCCGWWNHRNFHDLTLQYSISTLGCWPQAGLWNASYLFKYLFAPIQYPFSRSIFFTANECEHVPVFPALHWQYANSTLAYCFEIAMVTHWSFFFKLDAQRPLTQDNFSFSLMQSESESINGSSISVSLPLWLSYCKFCLLC